MVRNLWPRGRNREPARFQLPARHLNERFYEVFALRVGAPEQRQVAIVFRDVSAQKRLEEERATLLAELNHRVKNIFTVVRALAAQGGGDGSAKAYRDIFLGRLDALIRSHNLALDAEARAVDLKSLADLTLAPYARPDGAGCVVLGEPLDLSPRAALSLSMVLHELATNAAKYGALSAGSGQVDLSWRRESRERSAAVVHLEWRESNGPPVTAPRREGFGARLIAHIFSHDLGGEACLEFPAEGVWLRASFPLA